jgi:hypothetical protein
MIYAEPGYLEELPDAEREAPARLGGAVEVRPMVQR